MTHCSNAVCTAPNDKFTLFLCYWRDKARQAVYRSLFQGHLVQAANDDIRLALNQNQPLGNARFYAIEPAALNLNQAA